MNETVPFPERVTATGEQAEQGYSIVRRAINEGNYRWKAVRSVCADQNPFTRPVWIERVHVSLPSELMLADRSRRTAAAS